MIQENFTSPFRIGTMAYHKRFILSLFVLFATIAIADSLAAKDLRRKTELDRYVAEDRKSVV